MINDFVATVSADAMKRVSAEQSTGTCVSLDDEVFANSGKDVTRDITKMVSRLAIDLDVDASHDGLREEHGADPETKQRISQILDMGVYQPGISILETESDLSSESESESGFLTEISSVRSSRNQLSGAYSRKQSEDVNRFSVVSNPLSVTKFFTDNTGRNVKRDVSSEDGGDPETQGQHSAYVIREDAQSLLQSMMDQASKKLISGEDISTGFLGNVR